MEADAVVRALVRALAQVAPALALGEADNFECTDSYPAALPVRNG